VKSSVGSPEWRNVQRKRVRQRKVEELVAGGLLLKDALVAADVPVGTYNFWRANDKPFVARMTAVKAIAKSVARDDVVVLHGRDRVFDFAQERQHYFGHDSPAYQLEVVQAFEDLGPGDILVVLLPPNHGKTTLFEDWATLALAHRPSLRIHVGSESIALSKKILGRVQSRLENSFADERMTELIVRYGPFAPPPGNSVGRQPWAADHFDIFRKGEFDERDYSFAALGFGSQIIGSRSDHLHADDVQSKKSLGQTESNVETFIQDWLSRPGKDGITTVVGNRVDEGDFYEALIERIDSDILRVVKYPAIVDRDGEAQPFWPKTCPPGCDVHPRGKCPGWTMAELDKERRKHGTAIWERNWMQRPQAKMFKTFDEQTVDACLVPLRRLGDISRGVAHVIGLDPAIGNRVTPGAGRNALVTCEFTDTAIVPVLIREDTNLTNNSQILAALEDQIVTVLASGGFVSDVVIEENAFAKGLVYDPQLDGLRRQYGFAVRPHTTGANKHDENIGVPSMVHTMLKNQLLLPWAADDYTRNQVGELRAQFLAWKPSLRGAQLRQDILMALWFVWVLWRNRRGHAVTNAAHQNWRTGHRSPFPPTRGLVLPPGLVPSVIGSR